MIPSANDLISNLFDIPDISTGQVKERQKTGVVGKAVNPNRMTITQGAGAFDGSLKYGIFVGWMTSRRQDKTNWAVLLLKFAAMKTSTPKFLLLGAFVLLMACSGNSQDKPQSKEKPMADANKVVKTEEEWKKTLTAEQYHILREKGTDYPGTGKFYLHKEKGMYVCSGCGNELFTSDMKFDSGCGWPSFDKEIAGGKIKQIVDKSFGMVRIEIVCAKCDGHLGHIFDDGPTLTGKR
jgi:peptide-methionine (R)-S-oxide reductase